MMPEDEPVTCWIERIKAGSAAATANVWNHFYARLIGLARRKLQKAPRRVADEEDVVVSAFETFFRRTQQGRFPQLHDRHDLWHLLVKITERKALNQLRHQARARRGGGGVRGESVFIDTSASTGKAGTCQGIIRPPNRDLHRINKNPQRFPKVGLIQQKSVIRDLA